VSWLRYLRRRKWDRERREEIESYVQIETDENVVRGMPPDEARAAAQRKFGNATQIREEIYRMNTIAFFDTFVRDVRHALRALRHNPGFTLVAALTLALGIGANTAVFSLLNSLYFRPLNVPHPHRLARIFSGPLGASYEISYPNYVDLRGSAQSFSALAVYSSPQPIVLGSTSQHGPAPERIWGMVVSGNYFDTLGVSAALGRTFASDEDRVPEARPVVVISHRLWAERFNADPQIVGRAIRLNNHVFEIIGVAPDRMLRAGLLLTTDLWVPMMMEPEAMPEQGFKLTNRGETFLSVIGRLRDGVTLAQARAEATAIAGRMERDHPRENHGFGLSVLSEREGRTPFLPGLEQVGRILLVIVGLVLLIACANLAGLQLVRALARRKEFGIRASLGAGRWQLVRQLVTEGTILSLAGGLLALGVATFCARTLLKFTPPLPLEVTLDASIDSRVLLFTLGISVATGVLFSVLPAFHSTRLDLTGTLRAGDTGLDRRRSRLPARDALVIGQVALSVLLLIMAGLFVRSLGKAQQVNFGFEPKDRLLASVDTSSAGYTHQQSAALGTHLLEQVRSIPGVLDASTTVFAPLSGGYLGDGHVYIEGETRIPDYQRPAVYYDLVGDNFFRAMGTPLLAGRDFTMRDMDSPGSAAVVNQTFANTFWPGQSPLGKRFQLLNSPSSPWIEIVGLVPDGRYRSLGESPQRHVFLAGQSSGLVLHTAGDPHQYVKALRAAVQRLDPNLPLIDIETMNEHLGFALYPARMEASLLGLFGVLGLMLAMLGLYGVVSFVVRRRRREIGIRLALGARQRELRAMFVRDALALSGSGIGIGLAASLGLMRLVKSLLFGIGPFDPLTYIAVPIVLGGAAVLASYLPARRAAAVDPAETLRAE
jgi:macrolide transport system ATP-binding/permease protein